VVKAVDAAGVVSSTSINLGAGPAAAAGTPGYLTLLFGRTMWMPSANCSPITGQDNLLNIAQYLNGLRRTAGGLVVTDWIGGGSSETCTQNNLYPTWSDLQTLASAPYDWVMNSEGEDHSTMTSLTPSQQRTESCGSLTDPVSGLYLHNHASAWGMFAYPDGRWNQTIQKNVVSQCYAFGRTYNAGRNVQSSMPATWIQQTNSITGGMCNAPAPAPCAVHVVQNQSGAYAYYHSPVSLANLMNVAADEWVVVQMYKLVQGSYSGGAISWDCTSPDWTQHWTSEPEMYCENDWKSAVQSIPSNVETVDSATVAQLWNINPAVTQKPVPAVTSVTPSQTPGTGGGTITIAGSGFTGATSVSFVSSQSMATQAASFKVKSDAQILAVAPPGSGTVDVVVTTTRGRSGQSASDQLTFAPGPSVTGVAPGYGKQSGGDTVTITGSGFTYASAVNFGSTPAPAFSVNPSGTQITATSPAGSGTVDITVTTPGGTSATSNADQFTYVPVPTVTGVAPSCGPLTGSTTVTVTGSGFTYAESVNFGATAASSFTVNSDGEITATAPATASPGTVDVTVTTVSGTSSISPADQYTYEAIPSC
jgi:hypothetical protein